MHNIGATVAAVSTPPGKGGVALIRLSGPDAFTIADAVFRPRRGCLLSQIAPRMQTYGDIFLENEPIDDGMAVRFVAPHSYTGEDTVEITCHGGIRLSHMVFTSLLAEGAQAADAGEFTRRAFINGRLTLTEAEGIGQLLEAQTLSQIRLSRESARGRLSEAVDRIRTALISLMSSIYARIDYPDEDLGEFTDEQIVASLDEQMAATECLLSTYRTGHAIMEGVRTVIVGKPNVGKSTLYNALVGEEAAIVTDIAGTTRDVLERTVTLGCVTLRLTDTAGLRPSDDPIERIGVERSRAKLSEAELVFAVFDRSRPLDEDDRALLSHLATLTCPRIALLNKTDLVSVWEEDALGVSFDHTVCLSAMKGDTEALRTCVQTLFTDERLTSGDEAVLTTERQHAALLRTRERLQTAHRAFMHGLPTDAAASDIERAIGALSELSGREVSEQIVADIFSKFCVGK